MWQEVKDGEAINAESTACTLPTGAAAAPTATPGGSKEEPTNTDTGVRLKGDERNPFAFMKSFGSTSFMSSPRASEGGRRGFSQPSSGLSGGTPEAVGAVAGEAREKPLQMPDKPSRSMLSSGLVSASRAEGVDQKVAGLLSTDDAESLKHEVPEAEGGKTERCDEAEGRRAEATVAEEG